MPQPLKAYRGRIASLQHAVLHRSSGKRRLLHGWQRKERVWMADKKVTISELSRLRHTAEPREYALAAFYPLTHSGISAHHKRAGDRLPVIEAHPLLGAAPGDNHLPSAIAAECREAAARDAITPQGERLQRLIREHGYQRSPDEPKPWKKPWDK